MVKLLANQKIISRKDAKAASEKYYFTGVPCVRGHVALRHTVNLTCDQCIIEKARARYAADPVKCNKMASASAKRNRAKNRDKETARARAWQKKNPDKVRAAAQKYSKKNAEKLRAKAVANYWRDPEQGRKRGREAYRRNPEDKKRRARLWREANPEKVKENGRNRRALVRGAEGRHTASDIVDIFKMQGGRCAYCRKKLKGVYHVDHIIPLSKGGRNDRRNLQITCQPCNQLKYSRDPIDFARIIGKLL